MTFSVPKNLPLAVAAAVATTVATAVANAPLVDGTLSAIVMALFVLVSVLAALVGGGHVRADVVAVYGEERKVYNGIWYDYQVPGRPTGVIRRLHIHI